MPKKSEHITVELHGAKVELSISHTNLLDFMSYQAERDWLDGVVNLFRHAPYSPKPGTPTGMATPAYLLLDSPASTALGSAIISAPPLAEEPLAEQEEEPGPGDPLYAILWSLPNWTASKVDVYAFLKEHNISDARAKEVALEIKHKKGRPFADPWAEFMVMILRE